jgi:hypothetical protein
MATHDKTISFLDKAEQTLLINDKGATAILINLVLRQEFTNERAWKILHQLTGSKQSFEVFQNEFSHKYYPDKAYLLTKIPALYTEPLISPTINPPSTPSPQTVPSCPPYLPQQSTQTQQPIQETPRSDIEQDVGQQQRSFFRFVDIGIVILHVAGFLLPWMHASIHSLFESNSGSFSASWLAGNMDGFAYSIYPFYILTWVAYVLARARWKILAILAAIVAALLQFNVISMISGLAGYSDYGPNRDFLGGAFTGSVYVAPREGAYLALAAPIIILIGVLFFNNPKKTNKGQKRQ